MHMRLLSRNDAEHIGSSVACTAMGCSPPGVLVPGTFERLQVQDLAGKRLRPAASQATSVRGTGEGLAGDVSSAHWDTGLFPARCGQVCCPLQPFG